MNGYLRFAPLLLLAGGVMMSPGMNCQGPGPVDPITPVVPVNPVIVPEKLQIVIIEDPANRASLPSEQISIMDGQDLRSYAATHCTVTDGVPDMRILSLRQDVAKQAEWIQLAFKQPRDSLPHMVVLTKLQLVSGPLPKTSAETMAILKKYGGE